MGLPRLDTRRLKTLLPVTSLAGGKIKYTAFALLRIDRYFLHFTGAECVFTLAFSSHQIVWIAVVFAATNTDGLFVTVTFIL